MKILAEKYSDWKHLSRFFTQTHVDKGIKELRGIENQQRFGGDRLKQARAMAWRSYCTLNAVLEGWEIKDWGGGEDRIRDPDAIIDAAYNLAEQAMGMFGSRDFDILWAWAYAKMVKRGLPPGESPPDASTLARDAISLCRTRSAEGDDYAAQSLSPLLAEAADIFIYQGHLDEAEASIREAFDLDGRAGQRSPDWYHWVHALAVFNRALSIEDADRESANRLYREVPAILGRLSRPVNHPHYEFDSLRVHAAAYLKLGQDAEKQRLLDTFHAKLEDCKAPWTAEKEKFRSRYLDSGVAGRLKAKWWDIADALFPAPAKGA